MPLPTLTTTPRTTEFDLLVVGAGVIGLAVARAAAQSGQRVLVLEQEALPGLHTSSRNSEVIHAGLYYANDSLKARLCVDGRERLYAYASEHGVPHRRCGKLVVATGNEQLADLRALQAQAEKNGVDDLVWLEGPALEQQQPHLAVDAALWSPSTGIIDSHALLAALQQDLASAGGVLVLHSTVLVAHWTGGAFDVTYQDANGPHAIRCGQLVNSAGLWASRLAGQISGVEMPSVITRFARGHYLQYTGPHPFRQLVYPLPEPGGLGIHLTLDLQGMARFGPDVEWLESPWLAHTPTAVNRPDYRLDQLDTQRFVTAIERYFPELDAHRLSPAYCGIRPKAFMDERPVNDFVVHGPEQHGGVPLVQLYGIESPGLTCCLALAGEVVTLLARAPQKPSITP